MMRDSTSEISREHGDASNIGEWVSKQGTLTQDATGCSQTLVVELRQPTQDGGPHFRQAHWDFAIEEFICDATGCALRGVIQWCIPPEPKGWIS